MSGAAEDTWEDKTKYLSSATTFLFNKIILAQWRYTFKLNEMAKGLIFFFFLRIAEYVKQRITLWHTEEIILVSYKNFKIFLM